MRAAVASFLVLVLAAATVVLLRFSDFMDLAVYAWAGRELPAPTQLYAELHPVYLLAFTYTPAAALLFALAEPLRLLTPPAWTLLSLAALARVAWLLARHAPGRVRGLSTRWLATLLLALMLSLEPSVESLRLGQVNFLLAWLVLEDLLGPRRRWSGALVGLATAIKLTPGIFVPYLLVIGRWRAAAVATATLLVTIALGFVLVPAESRAFWGGAGLDATRPGRVEFIGNQSVNGLLWRLLGEGGSTAAWLLASVVLVAACLLLARAWEAGGQRVAAVGLAALGGLLASPISWTHHWVMVTPLLVGLWWSPQRRMLARGAVVASYLVLASRVTWRVPHMDGREFAHGPLEQLAGAAYLVVAAMLLTAAFAARPRTVDAAAGQTRSRRSRRELLLE